MEEDESLDPMDVSFLCSVAVVPRANAWRTWSRSFGFGALVGGAQAGAGMGLWLLIVNPWFGKLLTVGLSMATSLSLKAGNDTSNQHRFESCGPRLHFHGAKLVPDFRDHAYALARPSVWRTAVPPILESEL